MPSRASTELGALLRGWRRTRGESQLDLALTAGLSPRHLSFVESGRSAIGRGKLLDVAEALELPFRDRNALLLAAGYAPLYGEPAWNASEMRSITAAVARMLRQQEPFPAILLDRHWNVLATNDAAPRLFGRFVDLAARPSPRNLLHLMFDPAGLRPFVRDWDRVARCLLARVARETPGGVADARLRELAGGLVPSAADGSAGVLPMIPLTLEKDGVALEYFSMVSTVGTPTTISAQELRLECMFPVDEAAERRHLDFAGPEARPPAASPG